MNELINYSIETDNTVLLSFKNGRKLRVPLGELATHLSPADLAKIRSAVVLRENFIRQHMPKAVLVMAAGLMGWVVMADHALAGLMRTTPTAPIESERSSIVRSLNAPSPSVSPGPTASKDESVVAATILLAARRRSLRPTTPQPQPSVVRSTPLVQLPSTALILSNAALDLPPTAPTPSPSPSSSPSSSPLPTPTPSPAPHGEVLGETTGPDAPPLAD